MKENPKDLLQSQRESVFHIQKSEAVINPGIAAITVPSGVDCAALDGEPSNLFFMIAAPAEGSDVHLEALSRLSTILMDPAFREKLLSAK